MNRKTPPASRPRQLMFIEALEPRIAPAGLLNESKFTSVAVGGTLLLDASGAPGTFQGLTTGSGGGSGSYLLYLTSGRALVYTTDLNGNGRLDPGEITGISLGKDSAGHDPSLILFSDVNGDIVTNLDGVKGSNLTDSDHNPSNGRDGKLLTDTNIGSITIRTLTSADLDSTITGDTVTARLALTSFSIHGNIVAGGNIGAVTIDTKGAPLLGAKFDGTAGDQLYTGSTPSITGIYTGTAANNLDFHFTQNNPLTPQVEGTLQGFQESVGEHGGDISNVSAASLSTLFSIGTIATGDGGTNARGGNITNVTMHGATGGYELLAGAGGAGGVGGTGGSILNFNDLSSITGQVILHTGDGGQGVLGAGGTAGTLSLVNPQIAAQVEIFMGSGGAGFSSGGSGASFTSATFNTPETMTPVGGKFYGTWHNIGDVGNTHPLGTTTTDDTGAIYQQYAAEAINFNSPSFFSNAADAAAHGDNFGDGVYTSTAPDQVVVVFGDGSGFLQDNAGNFNAGPSATFNLKVPGVTNPVVAIGDFNGDGRPDIAVASGDPNNFTGIYVFLNQIGTSLDPINANNYTRSLVGDHPFSAAHITALPTFADVGYYQTSGAVGALAVGDFNGDGITDIAYQQKLVAEGSFATGQVVGILLGDAALNVQTHAQLFDPNTGLKVGSGYFYANTAAPRSAPALLDTFNVPTTALQATSLTNTNVPTKANPIPGTPDVVIASAVGENNFTTISLVTDPTTHILAPATVRTGLGTVDTVRTVNIIAVPFTDVSLQALSIQDLDGDGKADVVALSKQPTTYLVTLQGNGDSTFTLKSGSDAEFVTFGNDNSGIYLGRANGLALTAVDTNTDGIHTGIFDTIAVLQLPATPGPFIQEYYLRNPDGSPGFTINNGTDAFNNATATDGNLGRRFNLGTAEQDMTVTTLDAFYATVPTAAAQHPDTGYGALSPESTNYADAGLFLFTSPDVIPPGPTIYPVEAFHYLTENGYLILAGNGGGSTVGAGGKGGIVGAASTSLGTGTGSITINLPAAASYAGNLYIQGGNGGSGFVGGGAGGDVLGVAVRYSGAATVLTSDVEVHAGNGGSANGGDGGDGGSLSELSIQTGIEFNAGNAGSGVHGGNGGSILGNSQGTYDTFTNTSILTTGIGGEGALQGGSGGNISGWDSEFANFVGTGGTSTDPKLAVVGSLVYTTGAGGNAAGGAGGNGGSILNSSPDQSQNNLSGQLTLLTGAGGGGLSGGGGGAITNFLNSGTNPSAVPTALTVLTGNGGVGISGAGGVGGAITNFAANATGLTSDIGEDLTGIGRIIAGDGGASFGGAGGVGGSITKVVSTTTSTPLVVAGGAGGTGLTAGGDGGTVTNVTVDSAALQIGKLLVVAGRGGDATAAQPIDVTLAGDSNTSDLAHTLLAFGGAQGMAGNGGSIINLTQPVGAQTAVDLIAGNGGNTPNASTAITATTGAGHGGTVSGVTLTGTVGALSRDTTLGGLTNPAIQAYAATDDAGTTTTLSISAIIDLLSDPNSIYGGLSDNASAAAFTISGNVGIVAGASGTVRNGQPARDGVNGDVANVSAQSILSIVAGSVTSVAPVRIVSGLTLTNPDGVLGADKSQAGDSRASSLYGPNGVLDYFDPTTGRVVNTPVAPGDSLIDGAIFASTIQSTGGTVIRGPRVFPAATT